MKNALTGSAFVLAAYGLLAAAPAFGQEEKELGWADAAEVSYIATGGNAKANTLGLRNVLTHTWENALFNFEAAALRASTGIITRRAVGPLTLSTSKVRPKAPSLRRTTSSEPATTVT